MLYADPLFYCTEKIWICLCIRLRFFSDRHISFKREQKGRRLNTWKVYKRYAKEERKIESKTKICRDNTLLVIQWMEKMNLHTFISGWVLKRWSIASSADMVFPLPVGAPKRTLLSVWYRTWKVCPIPAKSQIQIFSVLK